MPMIPKAAEAIVTCSHPADPGDLDAAERSAASACGPRSTGPQLASESADAAFEAIGGARITGAAQGSLQPGANIAEPAA